MLSSIVRRLSSLGSRRSVLPRVEVTRRHAAGNTLALAALAVLALTFAVGYSTARDTRLSERRSAELDPKSVYLDGIRSCLGSELFVPGPNASDAEVGRATEALGRFVYDRSGVRLERRALVRLAALDRGIVSGATRRVTPEELADVLAVTLAERIRDLDDANVERAAGAFSNVVPLGPVNALARADDDALEAFMSAAAFRHGTLADVEPTSDAAVQARSAPMLRLRWVGGEALSADEFASQARALRARLTSPQQFLLYADVLRAGVRRQLDGRLDAYAEAMPSTWGKVRSDGATPSQAVLLAYSIASDDDLRFPTPALRELVRAEYVSASRVVALAPENASRPAFGPRGVLYSSPLDLALDAETVDRILDQIEERSSR